MLIPLLAAGAVAVGSYAYLPSSWRKVKHRLTRHKRQQAGVLYLTFDDGPSPQDTPALLDLLARYQVPATFFVVAEAARAHPQLIRRMQAEGHQVAFHSARHRSAYLMTPRQTRRDFRDGLAALDSYSQEYEDRLEDYLDGLEVGLRAQRRVIVQTGGGSESV